MFFFGRIFYLCFCSFILQSCSGGVINKILDKEKLHKMDKVNLKDGTEDADDNHDLGPPDHLDAVRVERDGHMNEEFHQEIFLGEEKHNFRIESDREVQKAKLEEIFTMVDENNDGYIDENELKIWIIAKTKEHLNNARNEANKKFSMIDLEKNGVISHADFNASFIEHYDRKYKKHDTEHFKNRLKTIQLNWKWADDNSDDKLTQEEFMIFQHPELSRKSLKENVNFFLEERDFNADKRLDLLEFVFGFPVDKEDVDMDLMSDGDELMKDRVHQFEKLLDTNQDKLASYEELMNFFDPVSDIKARNEAHEMVWFADIDNDKKLSREEVREASEYFTGTKLYGIERYFHNEL